MKKNNVTTAQLLRSLERMDKAQTRFLESRACWWFIAALAVLDVCILLQIILNKAP